MNSMKELILPNTTDVSIIAVKDNDTFEDSKDQKRTKTSRKEPRKREEFSIIRFLRQCMGMNQQEFSEMCQISAVYCHELESGKRRKPSDEIIETIAENCGIKSSTIRFFLDEQSEKSQEYKIRLIGALESIAEELSESI